MSSRVSAQLAQLQFRLQDYDQSAQNLDIATQLLSIVDGPDAVDIKRIKGDLYARQSQLEEAEEMFGLTAREIGGLDERFGVNESLVPS
jgi:hypothetical protein